MRGSLPGCGVSLLLLYCSRCCWNMVVAGCCCCRCPCWCWLAPWCLLCLHQAVMAWHAAGVLHLDIKPANVATTTAGDVVVLDAGVSRFATSGSVIVDGAVGYARIHRTGAAWRRPARSYCRLRCVQPRNHISQGARPLGTNIMPPWLSRGAYLVQLRRCRLADSLLGVLS